MALRPCKECGAKISTEASACPHCGCPVLKVSFGATFDKRRKKHFTNAKFVTENALAGCGCASWCAISGLIAGIFLIATGVGAIGIPIILVSLLTTLVLPLAFLSMEVEGACPYCGEMNKVPTSKKNFNCTSCGRAMEIQKRRFYQTG